MADKWIRCKLSATLLSSAHFGSGSGGGGIDSLVSRDRRGYPVIWASHVEGVLRDAARRLKNDDEAEAFFGRAGGDYARGDRQRAIFTSLYANENPDAQVWRSTARAAFDNRAPKDDTLRAIEYVPAGTTFVGHIELPEQELSSLHRLVSEVDLLGRGRATGSGHVSLSLEELPISTRKSSAPAGRLLVVLKNCDPVCISATATPGNFIPSLAFLPGRSLLGAVAAWLIGEGDRETASLLTSAKISVSDALPLPPVNHVPEALGSLEVLPAPLSLQSAKPGGSTGDVPWWAQPKRPVKRFDAWDLSRDTREKSKRPEDDLFVCRISPTTEWTAYRPARRVRLRNGRPQRGQAEPSLFATEEIAEHTFFHAEFRGDRADMTQLAKALQSILEGKRWLRVGRGGAPMEVVKVAWVKNPPVANSGGKVRLTLTSDLLMLDEQLRWRTALDAQALQELLGEDLELVRAPLQDSVMIHGFNGTSRLWRMPAAAIRRGSVFELSGRGIARLAERAARGEWLGERTHEGFGRFRLDATLPGITGAGVRATTEPTLTTDSSDEAVVAIARAWWGEHQSLAQVNRESKPSLSQWIDLITHLEQDPVMAINTRLTPDTAGAKTWEFPAARSVLMRLQALLPRERATYARYFVRWLRAAWRDNNYRGQA